MNREKICIGEQVVHPLYKMWKENALKAIRGP